MRNAKSRVSYSSEQCCQCEAVARHGLWGGLQMVHACHAALNEDGHLWGQRHGNAAQAPGRCQTSCRGGMDQDRHDRLDDAHRGFRDQWGGGCPEGLHEAAEFPEGTDQGVLHHSGVQGRTLVLLCCQVWNKQIGRLTHWSWKNGHRFESVISKAFARNKMFEFRIKFHCLMLLWV